MEQRGLRSILPWRMERGILQIVWVFSCVGEVSCSGLEESSSILGLFFMVAWHFELREAAGKENVKVQFCSRLEF